MDPEKKCDGMKSLHMAPSYPHFNYLTPVGLQVLGLDRTTLKLLGPGEVEMQLHLQGASLPVPAADAHSQ